MRTLYKLLFLIIFAVATVECNNEMKNSNGNEDESIEATNLNGTAWKLVGLVGRKADNNPTGALRELGPKDCDDCYTMWFDTDYTATGIGITSRIKLDLLNLNPFVALDKMMRCEVFDKDGEAYCDFDFFYEAMLTTGSYSVTDDELTLFQHGRSQNGEDFISTHLRFKRIDCAPVTLRGTVWHLQGIVDTHIGDFTGFEPINDFAHHALRFWGGHTIQFRSLESNPLKLFSLVLDNGSVVWKSFEDDLDSQNYAESLWNNVNIDHSEDNFLFYYGMTFAKSYELTQDELKLFFVHQEKNYYLLYKLKYQ